MIYQPEEYYFRKRSFPFKKAMLVTTQTLAQQCRYYKATLLAPKKGVREKERRGELLMTKKEKEAFIAGLFRWIFRNSYVPDLFTLYLNSEPITMQKKSTNQLKYNHHDDTCCWTLNLSTKEFTALKKALKKNKLPDDLFFPLNKWVKGEPKRLFWIFKGETYYTPKQWEMRQKK